MKEKKMYIHAATRKAERNHDAEKIDYLQNNIDIPSIREQTILDSKFYTTFATRIPDLILNPNGRQIILEHDTFKTHGDISNPNERTKRRNMDYYRADRPFIIIHEDLCSLLKLDEAKLAIYLHHHTMMQEETRKSIEMEGSG